MPDNQLPNPEVFGYSYTLVDEDRYPFAEFDAPAFERWLQVGLEGYLLEGQGTWAFPGAEGYILRSDHLVEGLEEAYRSMQPQQKADFRRAVAGLLASPALEASSQNVPVLEHLLSLAEALPAPEVLRVLPARLGNGPFGRLATAQQEALFSLGLLTAARLAAERNDAVECLNALIGSKNFDSAYSGIALVALCRADGRSLVAHMERLRKPLVSMFLKYNTSTEARRELARTILDAVGLSRLVAALPNLKYFDRNSASAATDGWLVRSLLEDPAPPLRCKLAQQANAPEMGEPCFYRPREPNIAYPLFSDGPGHRDLLDLLRDQELILSNDEPEGCPEPIEQRDEYPSVMGFGDALGRYLGLIPRSLETGTGTVP